MKTLFTKNTLSTLKTDKYGNSWTAHFNKYGEKGSSKTVHKARAHCGCCEKKAVVKTFLERRNSFDKCDIEIEKKEKLEEIVKAFNKQYGCGMKVNEVHKVLIDQRKIDNEWALIEDRNKPFLYLTDQYGVNKPEVKKHLILQTLLHFSYNYTAGTMVVTDLKGSVTKNGFRFSIPTIHSSGKEFGTKDEGLHGVERCFEEHVCSEMCAWMSKPSRKTEIDNMVTRPRTASAPYEPENLEDSTLVKNYQDMDMSPPSYIESIALNYVPCSTAVSGYPFMYRDQIPRLPYYQKCWWPNDPLDTSNVFPE